MAKNDHSSSFFSLIVPMAALVITTTLVFQQTNLLSRAKAPREKTYTFNLVEGYNSVVSPLTTTMTVKDVCDELDIDSLWRWDNHDELVGPRNYDCNDELLAQTEANKYVTPDTPLIFVLPEARQWTISGDRTQPNYDVMQPATYVFGFTSGRQSLYADDVCDMLDTRELGVREVYRLDPVGWDTTYVCDTDKDNFIIENGIGYALFIDKDDAAPSPRTELQQTLY